MAAATTLPQLLRRSDGCVHFSDAKLCALSMAHYRHAVTTPRASTPAMRRGTIVDRLTFGGDVAVCPLDDRRGTAWELFTRLAAREEVLVFPGERRGKAWLAFKEAHAGVRIYTQREHDEAAELVAKLPDARKYSPDDFVTWKELADAEPIAEALRTDPRAREFLAGRHQVGVTWEMMDVRCATGGIDVVGDGWISDLKVTQTTQPDRFAWHARAKMLWHAQLAFYAAGCAANGIDTSKGLYLVGVEATAPHPVTVLRMTERAIEAGQKAIHLWLEQIRASEATGVWPGYTQAVVDLDVPDDFGLLLAGDDVEELA